jgi:hypothetical protein
MTKITRVGVWLVVLCRSCLQTNYKVESSLSTTKEEPGYISPGEEGQAKKGSRERLIGE